MKINNVLSGSTLLPHLGRLLFTAILLAICFSDSALAQPSAHQFVSITYAEPDRTTEPVYALEHRVFDLVNTVRMTNGLKPLVWMERAAALARSHSTNMAENNYLGHRDPSGKQVDKRAGKFGVTDWQWIGENVAWVSGHGDPASRVMDSWMRSRGHRGNILQSKFSEGGIGMALAPDGKYYFTQVFLYRN